VILPQKFNNPGIGKASLTIGVLLCAAGLMSYPWRALGFLLWPGGPSMLWNGGPKAISILIYPGLHFAQWISAWFSPDLGTGYLATLIFATAGLLLNLALWTIVAYLMLRMSGSSEQSDA
jgi:hypothetical protein